MCCHPVKREHRNKLNDKDNDKQFQCTLLSKKTMYNRKGIVCNVLERLYIVFFIIGKDFPCLGNQIDFPLKNV